MKLNDARKTVLLSAVMLIITAFFVGAAAAAEPAPGTETYTSYIATPEWLKANLDKVIIIDARAQSLYKGQQGHLPGAVNAEWTYFANMGGKAGDPTYGTVVDAAAMAKKIGALGIDGKKEVIVYGDGGDWGNSSWVLWILRMTGLKNARILDGGFTVWRASGGKTSNTTHTNKAVTYPNAKYDESYIVTTNWMKENVSNPDIRVVDVRGPKEYSGEIRPFGERRPGHIPGAINLPMDEVFTPDFKIIPEEELQALFAARGFNDKEQTIILYDTSGVRGAFMTMIFRLAGFKNARNYDASYQAWCADPDTEIQQGPNP
ncbi:MAG: sulfurtransferase [Synergistaceae bacterium]|nr:sulfurtransferase [Synergistaceae bacterium]